MPPHEPAARRAGGRRPARRSCGRRRSPPAPSLVQDPNRSTGRRGCRPGRRSRRTQRPQGRHWVVVGDAAGSINPWNGDGIGPALTTGRLAAEMIGRAPDADDGLELRHYEAALAARWQRYDHLGRLTTRARPARADAAVDAARDSLPPDGEPGHARLDRPAGEPRWPPHGPADLPTRLLGRAALARPHLRDRAER